MRKPILDLVAGSIYFYGAIPAHDLYDLFRDRNLTEISYLEFIDMVFVAADDKIGPYKFIREGSLLYNPAVLDWPQIVADQMARPEVPFRHITGEQAEQAGNSREDLLWNECEQKLYSFIGERIDRSDSKEAAVNLMLRILEAVRNDVERIKIVQMVADKIFFNSTDELQILNEMIMEIWQFTPQWSLKGWSKQEAMENFGHVGLNQSTVAPTRKIGRNDPCPCGSGKKYKHCCLSAQEMH